MTVLRSTFFSCLLAAGVSVAARAQCPDGSPPPCERARPRAAAAAPAAPAPDPNRIAVLPFRVTTADSLLGEGLAELIATEFTGESGPRAVNMGTVLRAWRGAGGGLRSPLAQEGAMRLARTLGAGYYVEGSIVGLGSRLTINASVVAVDGGETRRTPAVAGPADSLDVLLGRLNSSLLAAAGSERGAAARARLTDSPAAMRSYLEGLSLWRAGNLQPSASAFERAVELDPGFARAAFMRWVVAGWLPGGAGGGGAGAWGARAWALRERLSAADRLLLIAQLGAEFPQNRPLEQRLADRQRAAEQLTESAEAQYFYGDYLYHYSSPLGVRDAFARAVAAFQRSVDLDSQATVLQHLVEIALLTGDTALAATTFPGLDRVMGSAWDWGMAVAALRGDQGMLAAQRRRAGPIGPRAPVSYVLADALVPAAAAAEIFDLLERHEPPEGRPVLALQRYEFDIVHGRPLAARRSTAAITTGDGFLRDQHLAVAALFADGDQAAGAEAVVRLRALAARDTTAVGARAACVVAFADLRAGQASWDEARLDRHDTRCAQVLAAVRAVRRRDGDALHLLLAADVTSRYSAGAGQLGFDRLALARAWEAHGDVERALAAVRVRWYGLSPLVVEAVRCREEGRLAALAGDTTGAVAAYRRYLALRQDAEPALVPQRDSVRAELARLTAR